jgi:hypothetical protein
VIQADIQRYLGPEAVVRPGEGRDADRVCIAFAQTFQLLTFDPRVVMDTGLLPIAH